MVTYERVRGLWLARLSGRTYTPVSLRLGAATFSAVGGDFDGDGIADPAVYQDATGSWLMLLSSQGYAAAGDLLGGKSWTAVPGDYDGDRVADPAVYQRATGHWLVSLSTAGRTTYTFPKPLGGDIYTAVPADYDGDGKTDPAVYGGGLWATMLSGNNYEMSWLWTGVTGRVPLVADFDGDRLADPALYNAHNSRWRVHLSSLGYGAVQFDFGRTGVTPMAADFDGDGLADPAVYQESNRTFYVMLSKLNYLKASLTMGGMPRKRVLILYDGFGDGSEDGLLASHLLLNLLSHFNVPCTTKPVEQYQSGDMQPYSVTFYIGSIYDNYLPPAFLRDAQNGTNTLCWIGFNIWQWAWDENWDHNPKFVNRYGFEFWGGEAGFSEVRYKGQTLRNADPSSDFGMVNILKPNQVKIVGTAHRSHGDPGIPYAVRSANLWFITENPLVNNYMASSSLVFGDLLHDILGIAHAKKHRAILRIEDVSAETPGSTLLAIAQCLHKLKTPFVVSLIPAYCDPAGVMHQGFPTYLNLTDNPELVYVLQNIGRYGGQIIQHGYTHQYANIPNPIGTTGADYEFYRVVLEKGDNITVGPLPEESPTWAGDRLITGLNILRQLGLSPVAWLTPHYYASPLCYGVFPLIYPIALDRGQYFAADKQGRRYDVEQVLPFMIQRDIYGQKRIPETVNYISPEQGEMPSNLVARAKANLVVRDGWAGCYYHWFFGTNYLPAVVTGIKKLGYQFVPVTPNME